MASVCYRTFCPVLKIIDPLRYRWLKGASDKFYSVYPPIFTEPVIGKGKIEKILEEKPEIELLALKVKPALNSQTCSMFYHPDVEKFINYTMRNGNKEIATRIVKDAFTRVKHIQIRKYNSEKDPEKKKNILINPLDVFLLAVKNVTPMLWYKKIKRSGSWYKVPTGISEEKAKSRAMKWLLEVASVKDQRILLKVQLAHEIVAAANYEGRTIAKKLEFHRMCEANRGYVNYWWT